MRFKPLFSPYMQKHDKSNTHQRHRQIKKSWWIDVSINTFLSAQDLIQHQFPGSQKHPQDWPLHI